jgi:P-type conjugative transfer protein TrbJ
MRQPPSALTACIVSVVTGLCAPSAQAIVVYDPANYTQNLLQALRSLQQLNQQVRQLQNEAQMLVNEARNLTELPHSVLAELEATFSETRNLLQQARSLTLDIAAIETAFRDSYGTAAAQGSASAQAARAADHWQTSLTALEDAMRLQAQVLTNADTLGHELGGLISASQGASGALAAAQAGNQLVALQARQLADLTTLLAADARARGLEEARRLSAEAAGAAARTRFIGAPSAR